MKHSSTKKASYALLLLLALLSPPALHGQSFVSSASIYDDKDGLIDHHIEWIIQNQNGMIWLGTPSGVTKFDGDTFHFIGGPKFEKHKAYEAFEDEAHNIWIATKGNEKEVVAFNTIDHSHHKSVALPSEGIVNQRDPIDYHSLLWTFQDDNVKATHTEEGVVFDLKSEYPGLPDLNIHDWIHGNAYTWIASDQGLIKIGLQPCKFQRHLYYTQGNLKINDGPGYQNTFERGPYGRNISSDNEGNIYVTTRARGIIDITNNATKVNAQEGYFWGSYFDGERYIWISRFDDILRRDLLTNTDQVFELPKGSDKAWSFHTDENDRLWIGCNLAIYYVDKGGSELKIFDHGFDEENILPIKQKYFFHTAQDGDMWMGTSAGLFKIDLKQGISHHYWPGGSGKYHLPVLNLRHMYEDREGIFWLATTEGLVRWDRNSGAYKKFGLKDGFSSERIYAVYGDDYGYLWLSSHNGLMQFSKSTFEVKAFQVSDGITHNIFNRVSHHQTDDGRIYFGGNNGVTSFHPKDFQHTFNKYRDIPVLLSAVHSMRGKDQQEHSKLESYLLEDGISFYPNESFLEMHFQFLNFNSAIPEHFEYHLDINNRSESEHWLSVADNNLQLAALPYGNHTLKVRGYNIYGEKTLNPLQIPIAVVRPFYLQLWFYLLLAVAAILMVLYYQRKKSQIFKTRQAELEGIVKERTRKIQTQAEELSALNEAKSRFLENISHEFRTPLTLISNILNNSAIDPIDNNEISEGKLFGKTELEILNRNSGRLKMLIEQLLDLSKLEAGKMPMKIEQSEIHFYLKGIVQTFNNLAIQNNIKLSFTSNAQSVKFNFDRDKMDKIFYNLLSNAIKFSPEGGVVQIDLQQNTNELVVFINDEGIGIPEKELEHIFDRFYQVPQEVKYGFEGTGLGLALVKDFVELHKGKIEVSSQKGRGTSFVLTFPLAVSYDTAIIDTALNIEESIFENTDKGIDPIEVSDSKSIDHTASVILIIEDNSDLRFYHQRSLSNQYNLLFAEDGKVGLEKAKEHMPDLIICDVMMPGKSGFEVCRELKQDMLCNHIPVILLTARASQSDRIQGISAGADDFMIKPFDQNELELRIQNILAQRALLQERYSSASLKTNIASTEEQDPFIQKLVEIIDINIGLVSFGISELSEAMSLSRSQLFRKVKATTGITPTDFLKKHRLKKAYKLLIAEAGNASEISYQVGFRTPNYFHKCFKEEFGFTPGEVMRSTPS